MRVSEAYLALQAHDKEYYQTGSYLIVVAS